MRLPFPAQSFTPDCDVGLCGNRLGAVDGIILTASGLFVGQEAL